MKKTAVALCSVCSAAALAVCLTGCGASYEGSGTKDAASAEQLAQKTVDPWSSTQSVTATTAQGSYKDGTYTGTGYGMDGKITVTISISSNKITVTDMTQDGETQSVGGYEAIRDGVYAAQIDAAQGTNIDGVAGATITSAGVKDALNDALAQAKN
jgi:uncharacterized protein with FMN-binding domain